MIPLRCTLDATEYKHVVLGLIFLKYISDAVTELHDKLNNEPGAQGLTSYTPSIRRHFDNICSGNRHRQPLEIKLADGLA